MTMEQDTIAAISTPVGEGAVGIVRLSGPEAISIAGKLFLDKNLLEVESHKMNYGKLIDPKTKEVAEEVFISVLRKPKTYTCEDVVEINCHGGIVSTNRVLQMVLYEGARLA